VVYRTKNREYNKKMDLTIPVGDVVLNIRVALIINTNKGVIFEKHKESDYYFLVGGRIKAGESSEEALKREVFEELGIEINNFTLKSVIENFFVFDTQNVHEICFVYQTEDILKKDLGPEFHTFNKSEIGNLNLKPEIMKKVIAYEGKEILHLITKDN
jgi:8-oxo-dGTP diphosphatase